MAKGQKIGALWVREQRGGGTYMTGEVEIGGVKRRVVVFPNGYRTEANRQPNLIVYEETQTPAAERTPSGAGDDDGGGMSSGPDNWR